MTSSDTDRFVRRWIVLALVYFVAAVALGVAMSASHDFRLRGVHVHVNMLGWVSMALTGLIYRAYPAAAASRLAGWHFVIYQASLPVMALSLGALLLGVGEAVPVVAASSVTMLIAIALFALAVWRHGGAPRAASAVGFEQAQRAA